ncbi:UNVERIFIED_CONTAM: hypothetical protein Sradi_4064200 [Sesamum radiatum]|uniref:Retrotransposon gag domain-containing protein n=1 Tax=Sesamum radiatum TaxID=300843 RepID=A0AAW2PK13_SESRA
MKSKSEFKAIEDLENMRSRSELPLPPSMIQLTPRALRQMIEDASAQAASRAVAQYIAEHAGPVDQQSDDQLEEEVESRPYLPKVELPPPPPPPRKAPPEEHRPQKRDQTAARQADIEKTKNAQAFLLAVVVAPPRRSPFETHILAKAIQPGIKIPNLSEYNGRFLHHFAINKRYPKTASYLFTIVQHEHEGLREYVQRFSEDVLEVPHVGPELLASIMQQNLKSSRFKESISGKPPATKEELIARAEKYTRIEETAGKRSVTPMKRRSIEEEGVMPPKVEKGRRERKHMHPNNLAYYTPLSVPRAEILAIAIQQSLVRRPLPMQDNPKRMKSEQFCHFHEDRGHDTEDCYNLKDEIERLVQKGHFREFLVHKGRINDFEEPR